MLRLLVLALLVANAGFYAWSQGVLDSVVGVRALGDREPARMARQIAPDVIRVLPPETAPSAADRAIDAAAVAGASRLCLEAGPFSPTQLGPAEASLQTALPPERWSRFKADLPAVWIVFMPEANPEARRKKINELARLNVSAEEVRQVPGQGDGLLLGRFSERASADKAALALRQQGMTTARVSLLSPATSGQLLRVERADAALWAKLNGLQGIALLGRVFTRCATVD